MRGVKCDNNDEGGAVVHVGRFPQVTAPLATPTHIFFNRNCHSISSDFLSSIYLFVTLRWRRYWICSDFTRHNEQCYLIYISHHTTRNGTDRDTKSWGVSSDHHPRNLRRALMWRSAVYQTPPHPHPKIIIFKKYSINSWPHKLPCTYFKKFVYDRIFEFAASC